MDAIKSHIHSENYGSIVQVADEICNWAVKMPEYFLKGGEVKLSKASAEIRTDFHSFKNVVT